MEKDKIIMPEKIEDTGKDLDKYIIKDTINKLIDVVDKLAERVESLDFDIRNLENTVYNGEIYYE